MEKQLLDWMKTNEGETFESPRNKISKRKKYDLEIEKVCPDRVKILFVGSKYPALPLYFWMFDRTLNYLQKSKEVIVRLGAKLQPPYETDTIEGQIWKMPYPTCNTSYKVSPHVCDILALSGIVEYNLVDTKNRRNIQGIRLLKRMP